MGEFLGRFTATDSDIVVTGRLFDVFENGIDHSEDCYCNPTGK